jgi:hypothetical protein
MARPRTGNTVKNITLTLSEKNLKAGKKIAFQRGISLSEMVDRLLVAELTAKQSIAMQHGRRIESTK